MNYIDTSATHDAISISTLAAMRGSGEKITCLTAYDASFAALFDQTGVDVLLVGDSLGNVVQGHTTTLPVTLEDMAYHTKCVARNVKKSLIVSDLPFASYSEPSEALFNAAQLMQAGAMMVKLEGGEWLAPIIQHLVCQGIPVCAHLGLTPQSVHTLGGFKVQGKLEEDANRIIKDAKILETAGAQLLVLEAIPTSLGKRITEALRIPTIGIGAGPDCSGQVLVMHDALGAFPGRKPKFVKNFLEGSDSIQGAIKLFIQEVKSGAFPAPEHCFYAN